MEATMEPVGVSKGALWAGRIVSGLIVLFMIFDGFTKVMKAPQVLEACARIGYPESAVVGTGVVLLGCTVLYVIPPTSILGAVLLTGYLGGATAINIRAASPTFNTCFSVTFGVLVWLGLFLREPRLRTLLPLRR